MLPDRPTEEVRLPRLGGFEVEGEEVAHRVPDHRTAHGGRLGDERGECREGATPGRAPQIDAIGVEPVLSTVVADPAQRVDHVVDLRGELRLAAEAIAAGHSGEAGVADAVEEPTLPLTRLAGARRWPTLHPPPWTNTTTGSSDGGEEPSR